MRRSILITLATLGSLICLLGGTGLFAALNDTATTGPSSVQSGAQAGSVDLKLATLGTGGCGENVDDLATGFFDASGLQPGGGGPSAAFCVVNVGSQVTALTVKAFALTDEEVGCTGDEADYNDASCGTGDGELSAVLDVRFDQTDCAQQYDGIVASKNVAQLVDDALALADLQPNVTACYAISASIPDSYPAAALQRAQSDRTSWRLRFFGVVAAP